MKGDEKTTKRLTAQYMNEGVKNTNAKQGNAKQSTTQG
jgi:hypothetical protein